jgi:hypothetical protein
MSARGYRWLFIAILSVAFAICAVAIPNFGNNAIGFTAIPSVAGVYTVTDNFAKLTRTQLPNGFMVDYAYTITSVDGRTMVDTTWTATRRFCLGVPAENLAVTISGSTTVSSNNAATLATADFLVNGTILGQNPDVTFLQDRPLANNMAINWNRTSNAANVPGANACYTLQMFSGPVWTPSAVGDTISFQSQYLVQVIAAPGSPMPSPTPVPSPSPTPMPSPSPTPMPSKPMAMTPDQPNAGAGMIVPGIQLSFTFDAPRFLPRETERQSVGEGRDMGRLQNEGWAAAIRRRYWAAG